MKNSVLKTGVFLLAAGLTLAGCAMHDDVLILENRIRSLQKKVSEQEGQVASMKSEMSESLGQHETSSQSLRGSQADLRSMVNELREEMLLLRGTLEENQYAIRQQEVSQNEKEKRWAILENAVKSVSDRIVRIEAYLGMEPSEKMVTPGKKAEAAGDTAAPESTDQPAAGTGPEALYAFAKQKFDRGEYEKARESFQAFLKQYAKSENADNAQFWLGEIYYREKWYEKAILEYQKVIEGYPKGNKVVSALLKQGFAFLNLGDKDNARLILKELVRKYPDSSEAKIATTKLENL
jgi:tol-pal system protein YbgF